MVEVFLVVIASPRRANKAWKCVLKSGAEGRDLDQKGRQWVSGAGSWNKNGKTTSKCRSRNITKSSNNAVTQQRWQMLMSIECLRQHIKSLNSNLATVKTVGVGVERTKFSLFFVSKMWVQRILYAHGLQEIATWSVCWLTWEPLIMSICRHLRGNKCRNRLQQKERRHQARKEHQ